MVVQTPQETITANAAEAEIKGIEIEIEWVPNDNFNLGVALAFNDHMKNILLMYLEQALKTTQVFHYKMLLI